jgi:hypothetical protein
VKTIGTVWVAFCKVATARLVEVKLASGAKASSSGHTAACGYVREVLLPGFGEAVLSSTIVANFSMIQNVLGYPSIIGV